MKQKRIFLDFFKHLRSNGSLNRGLIMARLVLNDDEIEIEDGAGLKEPCEEAGVPFACTEGICGTCVIEIREGKENLSEMTQEELDFLGETEEERLACQCKIKQGTVKIDY